MHLTFVYTHVSAILNFVYAMRSATDQLLQHVSFILFSPPKLTVLITFKPLPVLVASNGLGIVGNTKPSKTPQHNNRAS